MGLCFDLVLRAVDRSVSADWSDPNARLRFVATGRKVTRGEPLFGEFGPWARLIFVPAI